MKKVLVSVLNFHQPNSLKRLIYGLNNQEGHLKLKICIGDINATNKEKKVISDSIKKHSKKICVEYIKLKENLGYAKGNNLIIKKCMKTFSPDYILVTNPDIELPEKDTIKKLVSFLENNKNIALLGPRVLLNKKRQQGPYLKPNPWIFGLKYIFPFFWYPFWKIREVYIKKISKPKIVWRVIGAFFIVKANVFEEISFFDESTFLYWEEDILSIKLYNLNYRVAYFPNTTVFHNHKNISKKTKTKIISELESAKSFFIFNGNKMISIFFAVCGKSIYYGFWWKLKNFLTGDF